MVTFDTKRASSPSTTKYNRCPARDRSPRDALRRNGHVVRKNIEDQLYGLSEDGSPNAIEVYVHRLAQAVDDCNADVEIHTIRGSDI